MEAPPCTLDDAIEAIERCATTTYSDAEELPRPDDPVGRRVVHCMIPAGPMILGADWDVASAIEVVQRTDSETLAWRVWGGDEPKLVLYAVDDRDGRPVPCLFDTVHPRDDAILPGNPDVLLSELLGVLDHIEFGDDTTFDSIAEHIRSARKEGAGSDE